VAVSDRKKSGGDRVVTSLSRPVASTCLKEGYGSPGMRMRPEVVSAQVVKRYQAKTNVFAQFKVFGGHAI
jgi:hypothetical protein